MSATPLLCVRGLNKRFGGFHVLKDIDLEVFVLKFIDNVDNVGIGSFIIEV